MFLRQFSFLKCCTVSCNFFLKFFFTNCKKISPLDDLRTVSVFFDPGK